MVLWRGIRRRIPAGSSLPVIGMSRENLLSPIYLFDQHHTGKHVRPCRCAERQHQICVFAVLRRQAAGPANQKRDIAALIAPSAEFVSKLLAAERFSTFIHGDPDGACRKSGREEFAFAVFKLCRRKFPPFFDLKDIEWPLNAFRVFGDQITFRTGFQPSDGADRQPHGIIASDSRRFRGVGLRAIRQVRIPHFLKIVELPYFGAEQMHDDVCRI